MYTPFKVTIDLGAPVCLTFPWTYLDGILSFLSALEHYGQELFLFSRNVFYEEVAQFVPLKRTFDVYHGSAAIFIPKSSVRYIRIYKRFEDKYSDKLRKNKLRVGSGYFRSFAIAEPYIPAKQIIFYGNGDYEKVKYLFEHLLVGIGNDVRIGFGAVRKVKVKKIDNDLSIVFDGYAMRTIPINYVVEYDDSAYLTYKPPYWYKSLAKQCVYPGVRCNVRPEFFEGMGKD